MKPNIIFNYGNRNNYCLQMYISHELKRLKIPLTKKN